MTEGKKSSFDRGLRVYFLDASYIWFIILISVLELVQLWIGVTSKQINYYTAIPRLWTVEIYITVGMALAMAASLIFLSWWYRYDFYVRAVPLRSVFRVNLYLKLSVLSSVIFFVLGLSQVVSITLQVSEVVNFLVYGSLLGALNIGIIWGYQILVYFFSCGFPARVKRLFKGVDPSYIVGSEVSELLGHIMDARSLSLPMYSYLLVEIDTSMVHALRFAFPRLQVGGIDKALVDLELSIRTGSEKDFKNLKSFFTSLKDIFDNDGIRTKFTLGRAILNLLSQVKSQFPTSDELRETNEVIGHWNLTLIDKIEHYSAPILIFLTALVVAVTVLFGLHVLP